jgi:hypothetical protein
MSSVLVCMLVLSLIRIVVLETDPVNCGRVMYFVARLGDSM